MTGRKYSLEERKEIYSRPLEEQFEVVYKEDKAIVFRHIIRSTERADYGIVLSVAIAIAKENNSSVWLLPEINIHEQALRLKLGLSTINGYTPDIMLAKGSFVDVKCPESVSKITANACKASRQGGVACITNHSASLEVGLLDKYAKWVISSQGYKYSEVYFYLDGVLYKRARD